MATNAFRYKDLDLSFKIDPKTRDVSSLYDIDAVKQSVKNLVLISLFERRMNPWVGSLVYTQLFELFTPKTLSLLKKLINDAIRNFEPRVELRGLTIKTAEDDHYLEINVSFTVINLPGEYNTTIKLERLR